LDIGFAAPHWRQKLSVPEAYPLPEGGLRVFVQNVLFGQSLSKS